MPFPDLETMASRVGMWRMEFESTIRRVDDGVETRAEADRAVCNLLDQLCSTHIRTVVGATALLCCGHMEINGAVEDRSEEVFLAILDAIEACSANKHAACAMSGDLLLNFILRVAIEATPELRDRTVEVMNLFAHSGPSPNSEAYCYLEQITEDLEADLNGE